MTNYQKFLEAIGIMPEECFNEVINSFSDINIDEIIINIYQFDSQDELATNIIDNILRNWEYAYPEHVNFKSKTFDVEDVESLEDLESIKQKFSNWNITNYDELREYLLQENKKDVEHQEKINLIINTIDNIPIEDLKEFIEKYVNKG